MAVSHWLLHKLQEQTENISVHVLENGNIATRATRGEHRNAPTMIGVYNRKVQLEDLVSDLEDAKSKKEEELKHPYDQDKTA